MKRMVLLLLFSFFLNISFSQIQKEWISDLDTLKLCFLKKEHLFKDFSKQQFIDKIERLKKTNPKNLEEQYWLITDVLNLFKQPIIQIKEANFGHLPFRVREFNGNYYLTRISLDFENNLGAKIQKINGTDIFKLLQKTQNIEHLSIKSFLKHYQFNKTDTLRLNIQTNVNQLINFNVNTINDDVLLATIHPKKTPFYLQKQERWFWSYGINYGQQMYFKLNRGLSKEFLKQVKDSLQLSDYQLAKRYHIRLQEVYDAPKFDDFTEKLFQKFKKRRYKKLFIDVRNLKIGDTKMLIRFIDKLQKLKRINRKSRLFIFVDKQLSFAAMNIALYFKQHTNATIVGEKLTQTACNTNQIKELTLPNSNFYIRYPNHDFKAVQIEPKIKAVHTFEQFVNGIDPILQKVIEE